MKTNKKIKILTLVALSAALLPFCKTFASISLDDAFRGGVKSETIVYGKCPFEYTQLVKWAWASTRKEENGKETYQGHHYLRCYKTGLLHFDTGQCWAKDNKGFLLESQKVDVTGLSFVNGGGFKACYGD